MLQSESEAHPMPQLLSTLSNNVRTSCIAHVHPGPFAATNTLSWNCANATIRPASLTQMGYPASVESNLSKA